MRESRREQRLLGLSLVARESYSTSSRRIRAHPAQKCERRLRAAAAQNACELDRVVNGDCAKLRVRHRAYTGAVPDAELRTITVDYTIEFARVLRGSSPESAFAFLSGMGADPTGRSRVAFARYKGEAEKALLAAGFPHVYLFRPAYIYPAEPRKEPNFSYRLLRAIYPVFRLLFPNQVIRADDLAQTIVDVVVSETAQRGGPVFENRDIRAMVKSFHPRIG